MLRDHIPDDVMPDIAQMSAFGRLIEPAEIGKTLLFAATKSGHQWLGH
jgi:hypothetical protein